MADKLKVDAIERCIQWVKDDLIRDRPSYESQGRKLVSEAQAELAQLSQAVEAATAPLHGIIKMQNAERIAINEENQRNYNDLVARQEAIVEAAQGVVIEAAARLLDKALHAASDALIPEGTCANADQEEGYSDGVCCTLNLLWKSVGDIRALQTEPMAAALAARDAKLIRNAATKLSVEEYECMERRIEAAQVAITQLQVVIESLKIADS